MSLRKLEGDRPVAFERFGEPALSLFRMVVGFLFLCHGMASLFGVLGGNRGTGQAVGFAVWPGWWAALIQFICGGLVLAGLFTRAAALLASGSMAYAYFIVHQPDGLFPLVNNGEPAALFCWAFFLIAVLGPGPWTLGRLIRGATTGSVASSSRAATSSRAAASDRPASSGQAAQRGADLR